MNRNEAKKKFKVEPSLIDKIYDDFESRTCENCKLDKRCPIQSGFTMYLKSTTGSDVQSFDNFGCNKFERKEE